MKPIVPSNTLGVSLIVGKLFCTSRVICRAAAFASNPLVGGTRRPMIVPPDTLLISLVAMALSMAVARSANRMVEAFVATGFIPPRKSLTENGMAGFGRGGSIPLFEERQEEVSA